MREPLPKALVRLAWKARVGYSAERTEIQRVYVQEREKTLKIQVYRDSTHAHNKCLRTGTYSDPGRNQITLIENKNEVLVRLLFFQIPLNMP